MPAYSQSSLNIPEVQRRFYGCVNDLYVSKKQTWQHSQNLCVMAFNVAFEKQNVQFEIPRSRADGPRSYFLELSIRTPTNHHLSQKFEGHGDGDGRNCPPAARPATVIRNAALELTQDQTFCSPLSAENGKQGAGASPKKSFTYPPQYGFGFKKVGESCERICPSGQVLSQTFNGKSLGSTFQCVQCGIGVIRLMEQNNGVMGMGMGSNLFPMNENVIQATQTQSDSNFCVGSNGCPAGLKLYGRTSEGKPNCQSHCMTAGETRNSSGECIQDPDYCKKGSESLAKNINWRQIPNLPANGLGRCNQQQLRREISNYQSFVQREVSMFEDRCNASIRTSRSANKSKNTGKGGMGFGGASTNVGSLGGFLMGKCFDSWDESINRNMPQDPLYFSSDEVTPYLFILMTK